MITELRRAEDANKGHRSASHLDYIVGNLFAEIYRQQFGELAATRGGPFVRFALASLKALGLQPCDQETIMKALTRFRRG